MTLIHTTHKHKSIFFFAFISDSGGASRLDRGHRNNGTNSSSRSEQARSCSRNSPGGGQQDNSVEDFDSLLKQVRAGLRK